VFFFERLGIESFPFRFDPARLFEALPTILEICRLQAIEQLWIVPSTFPSSIHVEMPGWDISGQGTHWLHCFERREGFDREPIDIVFPALDRKCKAWASARTPAELLASLVAFESATGERYRWSPERTAGRILERLHYHGERLPVLEMPPPALETTTEMDAAWSRPLRAHETSRKWVDAWDVNAAYLSACSSLALGAGDLRHTGPGVLRPKLGTPLLRKDPIFPGYYRAHVLPAKFTPLLPDPRGDQIGDDAWISAPTLELLREIGYQIDVLESWTWAQTRRPLEPWYKRLRDARASLMEGICLDSECAETRWCEIALAALKLAWGPFLGGYVASQKPGWDRSADPLFRPDWRHHVIATTRARQYRTLVRVMMDGNVAPFAVATDCLYFATDTPGVPPAGLRVGANPGAYKHAGTISMDAIHACRHDAPDIRDLQMASRGATS
jgi:hypothetical protein